MDSIDGFQHHFFFLVHLSLSSSANIDEGSSLFCGLKGSCKKDGEGLFGRACSDRTSGMALRQKRAGLG